MRLHSNFVDRALLVAAESPQAGAGLLATTLLTGLTGKHFFEQADGSEPIAQLAVKDTRLCIAIRCRAPNLGMDAKLQSSPFAGVRKTLSLSVPGWVAVKLSKDLTEFKGYETANAAIRQLLSSYGFAPRITWLRLAQRASEMLQASGLVSAQLYGSQTDTSYCADGIAIIQKTHHKVVSDWLARLGIDTPIKPMTERENTYWGTQGVLKYNVLKQLLDEQQNSITVAQLAYDIAPSLPTRITLHNALALRAFIVWHLATAARPLKQKILRLTDIDWSYHCVAIPNKSRPGRRIVPLCSTAITVIKEYVRWCKSLPGTMAQLIVDALSGQAPLFVVFKFKGLKLTLEPITHQHVSDHFLRGAEAPPNFLRKTTIDFLSPEFYGTTAFDAFTDHNKATASIAEMQHLADAIDRWLRGCCDDKGAH